MVNNSLKVGIIGVICCGLGLGGCRPEKTKPTPTPTVAPLDLKLELDNLSFEQVDKQGKPLWRVRAAKGVYSPNRKRAKVTNLSGDFYQDGKIAFHLTAKTGEVEQEGEKIFLRGDVTTYSIKNNLVLVGQEVEWQPKTDLLTVSDRVQATHPSLQANADRCQYFSRKEQLELNGKITSFTREPRLAMQTEHLTWLVKSQKIIGDRPVQVQRYQGEQIIARATANSSISLLDRKIIDLRGNVRFNNVNPPVQVDGEAFSWSIDRQIVTTDRPLKIVHSTEQVTLTGGGGEVNLAASTATLATNAQGFATRNRAKLRADKLVWEMTSQQLIGTGNVVYQQTNPQIKFTGSRGIGKLQDQSVVISSDQRGQVRTEVTPKQ